MTTEVNVDTPAIEPDEQTPAPDVQDGEQQAESEPTPEEQAEKEAKRERLNLRFSELTNRAKAAEEKAQQLEAELAAYRGMAPQEDEQYPDVLQQVVRAQIDAQKAAEVEVARQQAFQAKASSLKTYLIESGLEGAVAVANGLDIPFSVSMIELAADMPEAPQVVDYLAKNPQEAARLRDLPLNRQGFEMARLAAKLATPAKPPVPVSKAPAPVSGIRPGGSATQTLNSNMTPDEWRAARMAQRTGR